MPVTPELRGKASLDASGWSRGLKQIQTETHKAGAQIGASLKSQIAGAFTTAAVASAARAVVDHVGRIKDLSEEYRATTSEIQVLDAAMVGMGKTAEDAGALLLKLGEARQQAGEGNTALAAKFEKFGVTMQDIQSPMKRNVDLFFQMGEALKGMKIDAGVESQLGDILGKSAPRFISAMQEMQTIRRTGGAWIISPDEIENIDRASKALDKLLLKAKARGAGLLNQVLENPMQFLWVGNYASRMKDLWGGKGDTSFRGAGASGAWGDSNPLFTSKPDKAQTDLLSDQAKLLEEIDKLQRGLLDKGQKRAFLEGEIRKHMGNAGIMSDATDTAGRAIATEELSKATDLLRELAPLMESAGVSGRSSDIPFEVGGFAQGGGFSGGVINHGVEAALMSKGSAFSGGAGGGNSQVIKLLGEIKQAIQSLNATASKPAGITEDSGRAFLR